MFLIKCPECGGEVSALAELCPSCGCRVGRSPKSAGVDLEAGDAYLFGNYAGEPIEWRVLEVRAGKALLISAKALDCKPYNEAFARTSWAECSLRSWLNGEFLTSGFDASERSRIASTRVVNADNPNWGTPGGADTHDYVFLLSIDEAKAYFKDDEDRVCYPTAFAQKNGTWIADNGACYWWLRSAGSDGDFEAGVYPDGDVGSVGNYVDDSESAVRPALWIDL